MALEEVDVKPHRSGEVRAKALRPRDVAVPDGLWRSAELSQGAKLLWCYLQAGHPEGQESTFADLRRAAGICQNSLLKHLDELAQGGWLRWRRTGRRGMAWEALRRVKDPVLNLPTELLLDRRLSHPSRWVWGLIRRMGGTLDYRTLREQAGCGQEGACKYLSQLCETGWFVGRAERAGRQTRLDLRPVNPFEIQRQAELAELAQALELARKQEGYSVGQCLLARMVRLLSAETIMVENAELTGLDNLETGGRMHYDLLLPRQKVAIEYHGPQHDRPTTGSPARRDSTLSRRDLLKLGLSKLRGIDLLVVRPADLSFPRLRELLDGKVPLKPDTGHQWHLYEYLERVAAHYRKNAAHFHRMAAE